VKCKAWRPFGSKPSRAGFAIFDVTDPANASLLTTYDLEPGNGCGHVAIENNLIIARDQIYIRFFSVADLPSLNLGYEFTSYGSKAFLGGRPQQVAEFPRHLRSQNGVRDWWD